MISALYLHSTSCPMETSSVQIEQDEEVLYFGESVFFPIYYTDVFIDVSLVSQICKVSIFA